MIMSDLPATLSATAPSWEGLFGLPIEQRRRHRLHLIGIGGTGLAPIANVLVELGYQVSGSDQAPSPRTEALMARGVRVGIGHDAAHLTSTRAPALPDLVLVSSAVPSGNPEIQAARRQGIPVVKRKELLGPLTNNRQVIAVAGTHGKTTTTGMIAHVLQGSGLAPGYIIGSSIPGLGFSAAGAGPHFVIEADEYDNAFWGLRPQIMVITNIDWDHPDFFPSAEAYEASFSHFVEQLRPGGYVIYCQDDSRTRALAERYGDDHWLGYGARADAQWRIQDVDITASGTGYQVRSPGGGLTRLDLCVPGYHNALNGAAALLVAGLVGIPDARSADLLATYQGAGRRFEIKGETNGVLVVDDYAHHPTEIRATLAAARAAYPDREIWAVYQPHTYSRTRTLRDRFEGAFGAADHALITDIYAAREPYDASVTPAQVAAASRHPDARSSGSLEDTLDELVDCLRPGSLVVILSAGSATQLGPLLLERLAAPHVEASDPHHD